MEMFENNVSYNWEDPNGEITAKDLFGDDDDNEVIEENQEAEDENEDEESKKKKKKEPTFIDNVSELDWDDDDENDEVDDSNQEDDSNNDEQSEDEEGAYSDLLKYLQDGAIPEITDEQIKSCNSGEDLSEIIQSVVEQRLDEETKAIRDAYRAHQDPNGLNTIKNTIAYLDNITDEYLEDEDDKGAAELRKNIIIDYYMKKGSTKEEALDEYSEIYDAGKEIEKAKKLLPKVKDEYSKQYKSIQDNINRTIEEEKQKQEEEIKNFKKAILEEKTAFGDLDINKETKNKIFDYATKPTHKDPKDPKKFYTELDWQIMQNPIEWKKMMALVGVITDNGKNLNNIAKVLANKEVKKEYKNIASKLKNGNFRSGSMKLVGEYDTNDRPKYDNRGRELVYGDRF